MALSEPAAGRLHQLKGLASKLYPGHFGFQEVPHGSSAWRNCPGGFFSIPFAEIVRFADCEPRKMFVGLSTGNLKQILPEFLLRKGPVR